MTSNAPLLVMFTLMMTSIPHLTSPKLSLIPLSKNDKDFFLTLYNDPQTIVYLGKPLTQQEMIDRFEFCLRLNRPNSILSFIICCRQTNKKLGVCAITWSKTRNEPEVGVHLKSDNFGHGYATLALTLLIKYACYKLKLPMLLIQTDADNNAMLKTIAKLPFKIKKLGDSSAWHIMTSQ